jgi:type IV secretion system protein TrbL
MATPDSGVLTTLLNKFLTVFNAGFGPVGIDAWSLLGILAIIELTLAAMFWALKGEDALVGLIRKILLICMFIFFVKQWPSLIDVVAKGFEVTGNKAGGGSGTSLSDPSAIVVMGWTTIQPIETYIDSITTGWIDTLTNLPKIILYMLAELLILFSFVIMAIQAFITYLEFYLVAVLALILIPFGVHKHTAFISEKAFGMVIAHGVKLMVLAFILSATIPVLATYDIPTDPKIIDAFSMAFASLAVLWLAWHAPAVASGMMAGGPSLTAGSAAGVGMAAGAGIIGAAIGGVAAAKGAGKLLGRGAKSTTAAAGAGASGAASAGAGAASPAGGGGTGGAGAVSGSSSGGSEKDVSARMSEKVQSGDVKDFKSDDGTGSKSADSQPPPPPPMSSTATAAQADSTPEKSKPGGGSATIKAANAVHMAKSAVPGETGPAGGISAPIKHDD